MGAQIFTTLAPYCPRIGRLQLADIPVAVVDLGFSAQKLLFTLLLCEMSPDKISVLFGLQYRDKMDASPHLLSCQLTTDRLSVSVPSGLYNHVSNHAALMRLLAIESVQELAAAITEAAVGRSREEALRAVAVAYRAYALEHPGRYAATVRAPEPDDTTAQEAALAAVSPMVAILAGWGIEGPDAVHLVRVARSALHGFVSIEMGGGFGLELDLDHSFDLLVDSLVAAIEAQAEKAS